MKFECGRVSRQFDGNAVLGFDGESAGAESADARNLYLLRREGDVVFASLLDDGLANIVFRARGVGGLRRFGLDCILEFVIRKEWRNELEANHAQCHEDAEDEQ